MRRGHDKGVCRNFCSRKSENRFVQVRLHWDNGVVLQSMLRVETCLSYMFWSVERCRTYSKPSHVTNAIISIHNKTSPCCLSLWYMSCCWLGRHCDHRSIVDHPNISINSIITGRHQLKPILHSKHFSLQLFLLNSQPVTVEVWSCHRHSGLQGDLLGQPMTSKE